MTNYHATVIPESAERQNVVLRLLVEAGTQSLGFMLTSAITGISALLLVTVVVHARSKLHTPWRKLILAWCQSPAWFTLDCVQLRNSISASPL